LWGLLKSFISQLKIGDQITKISLPSEMCYPYSMLEMVAFRQLSLFKALYGINTEDDPLKRMLIVLRYFACLPRNETHNKKPWNPILGETHMAYVEDEQYGRTEFISEQISHHPPVSAFHVQNDKQEFEVTSNLSFNVKFTGNSASVSIAGPSLLQIKKLKETYRFSRCIPAMVVRNLVLGTKYIVWDGECIISCPETGLECKVTFKEGWSRNTVMSGSVYYAADPKKPIYTIEGNCGEDIKLNPKSPQVPEKSKFSLVNVSTQVSDKLLYLPEDKLEPMSSVVVWGPVNAAVLEHNTTIADQEKSYVEQEQRRLRAERAEKGAQFEGQYFCQKDNLWVLREGVTVSKILSGEVPTISMVSYSARGDHLRVEAKPPTDDHDPIVNPDPTDTDPNVQSILSMAQSDELDHSLPPPPTEPSTPAPTEPASPAQTPLSGSPVVSHVSPSTQ